MATRYRKRPAFVEAVQFTGTAESRAELEAMCGHWISFHESRKHAFVTTPSGSLPVEIGNYVVKGSPSDFYPVGEERFAELFEVAD